MRRSYYELYIHLVWTTKNREQMIKSEIEETIHNLTIDKCKKFDANLAAIGNTEDYVHLLISISPETKISELVCEVKGITSYFINQKTNQTIYWQDGYGALSVSKSGINVVKRYIKNQKEHHSTNKAIPILEKVCNE